MMIKDEIYGTIEFDDLEERIIDSEDFQRLRRIKQMSVTNLVYPGANHTRFEHSLGTAHLSGYIAERVGLKTDEIKKVKLFGLLHDIGHTVFSHEGEDVLKRHIGSHEEIGKKKILHGDIADIISENYNPGEIAESNIVTSDIGADRMDYLKRDAQNTGVAYGIIDLDRIVHTLMMKDGELCIKKGGLAAAEYLLVARFMMFSTVYLHKTVRIATAMLYRAMEGAIEDGFPPKRFTEIDDEQAMAVLLESEKGRRYAEGLKKRKLFKEVCSVKTLPEKLEDELKEEFEVIVDRPHQFFKPVGFKVDSENGPVSISEISNLVKSLKTAEEERMKILILASDENRKKFGKSIMAKAG
ncbi:HD domain-containing protein [Candidatus Micrarchaeota archaeon]|nr:HD domain-containing protein [Candidatus Micrarchaeota archaeon]